MMLPAHKGKLFSSDSNDESAQLRLGLIAAFFLYGIFGILDVVMLPESYMQAWMIRYAFITPLLFITYILSFTNIFRRVERPFLVFLVFLGQIGILAMIVIAEPTEEAFYGYYAGLILIILWASFVFQFTIKETLIIFLLAILLYNLVAILHQDFLSKGMNSKEFAWFLGNNFFTIATGLLALIGSYHLQKTKQALREENIKLKAAKEKAEGSDRLKTSFLQNISHEIRTPMNSILGFINLLQEPDISDDEKQEYYDIIKLSSDRMLNTMHHIIEVAKFESKLIEAEPSNFDLNAEIIQLIELNKPQALGKGLSLRLNIADSHHKFIIRSDKDKVRLILNSLLDNAIKFTDSGTVTIGYKPQTNSLHFFVKDTGIGIEDDKQQTIFERFMQADTSTTRRYEGTGLGLTLAKAYTDLLGGSISLSSAIGKGSTFQVTLPYKSVVVPEKTAVKLTPDQKTTSESQASVLIVEDDDSNAMYLQLALKQTGIKLIRVDNGLKAVEICRNYPGIQLILMDIKMPVMDGIEATKTIRQFNREVIIIAQTAYVFSDERVKAIEAGCNDFIAKPVNRNQLIKLVNGHLK